MLNFSILLYTLLLGPCVECCYTQTFIIEGRVGGGWGCNGGLKIIFIPLLFLPPIPLALCSTPPRAKNPPPPLLKIPFESFRPTAIYDFSLNVMKWQNAAFIKTASKIKTAVVKMLSKEKERIKIVGKICRMAWYWRNYAAYGGLGLCGITCLPPFQRSDPFSPSLNLPGIPNIFSFKKAEIFKK